MDAAGIDLIAAAVAGVLDDAGAAALAALAGRDRAVLRALRLHLLIDEIAAEELLPTRNAAAFAAGLAERRRAEGDAFAFLARVRARVAAEDHVIALLAAPVTANVPEPLPVLLPERGLADHWWPGSTAAAAAAGILLCSAAAAHGHADDGKAPASSLIAQSAERGVYLADKGKETP